MKEKLLVTSLLLCLSLSIYTKSALVETYTLGVNEGDFFYYEMYAVFTSSNPNRAIEVPAFEQNNSDWVRIDITEVSGSVIYQIYTIYFDNKTEKFELKTDLDVSNADSSFSDLGIPICVANLEVGDTLSTVQLKVKETLIRTYPNGDRETNHVSWSTNNDYGDCYFDKKTGMLVELNRTHLYINSITDEIIKKVDIVKMTNSSFWSNSDFSRLVLSTIITTAMLGVFLLSAACCRHVQKEQELDTKS